MAILHPFLDPSFIPPTLQQQHDLLDWFLNSSIDSYFSAINKHPSLYWAKKGEQKTLNLFHQAAKNVPAYRDFLKKNKVDEASIQTMDDFKKFVPILDKKNYISQYSLEELSWHGNLHTNSVVSFSSGTSGSPFFWPRGSIQDIEGAFFHEHILANLFEAKKKKTLIVVCFALGNYVAGTYTFSSLQLLALKGYPLTIVTPGINYEDSYRMIKKLAPSFEQIILCGYPPFIKDTIELGKTHDINWKKFNIKFLFASEFFSEEWRTFILKSIGKRTNLKDSTNIYGAADATLFGFETPITTLLRNFANRNRGFHQEVFSSPTTPTVVQYNPLTRFFETVNGELILSAASGIPLLRYNLHDYGKILSIEEIEKICKAHSLDFRDSLQKNDSIETFLHLPIVTVNGRTDGAVSLYGLLIYPEYIRFALEQPTIHKLVSGKFSLEVKSNENMEQRLHIHIELNHEIEPTPALVEKMTSSLKKALKTKSSEYVKLSQSIKEKALPNVLLYKKMESDRFAVGTKQRWIVR